MPPCPAAAPTPTPPNSIIANSASPRNRSWPTPGQARPGRSPAIRASVEYRIAIATSATAAPMPPSSRPSTMAGPANVAERRADQLHDLELIATRVERQPDDRGYGKGGAEHQDRRDQSGGQPRGRHNADQARQPLPIVANVADAGPPGNVARQSRRPRHRRRSRSAAALRAPTETDSRRRRRHVAQLREIGAEALERALRDTYSTAATAGCDLQELSRARRARRRDAVSCR